ncbi:MAG: thiaminase II [Acidobacteria bacterium]|nr:MAG: thiaminase II [Acidobacteriota bacterium]
MTYKWLLLCFLGSALAGGATFTGELWDSNRDIYGRILEHPFLKQLSQGTLKREAFAFYMIQDAHYLREFSRALNITASKAPREDWAALLSTHAAETLRYERKLHESVFRDYGISEKQVRETKPSPDAFAYTSFLVANAHTSSFGESLAALLPCYWIYWEVGKELKKKGSSDPVYQKWIDAYSAEGYGESVKAVLAIMDEVARQAGPAERQKMKENFRLTSRYEWMFWDSAYHLRKWPPNN